MRSDGMGSRRFGVAHMLLAVLASAGLSAAVTGHVVKHPRGQEKFDFYVEAAWDLVVLRSACQDYLSQTGKLPETVAELSLDYRQRLDEGRLGSEHMSFECLSSKDGRLLSGGVLIIFDPEINYPIVDVIDGPVTRTVGGQPR